MTDLVATISPEPTHAKHVERVMASQPWRRVFLIAPHQVTPPFHLPANAELVSVDFGQPIHSVVSTLQAVLKPNLQGTEVGLNLIAGTGKEHMAVLSAVLGCGVGFRLVALTKEGVMEV